MRQPKVKNWIVICKLGRLSHQKVGKLMKISQSDSSCSREKIIELWQDVSRDESAAQQKVAELLKKTKEKNKEYEKSKWEHCKAQPRHASLSYPFHNTAAHTEATPTREGI